MCYRGSLQNGHTLKNASLNALSPDHPVDQDLPDNNKSYLQNSAMSSEGALETTSQDTNAHSSHLPASSEPDLTSTAFTSSAPDGSVEQPQSSPEKFTADPLSLTDAPSSIIQTPRSDLREDPQPATSQQSAETKDQNHEEDLLRDPVLANGLSSEGSETIERSSQAAAIESQERGTPLAQPADQMDVSRISTETVPVITTEIPNHPPMPIPEGAYTEAPIDPAPSPAAPMNAQTQAPAETQPSNIIEMHSTPPKAPLSPPPPIIMPQHSSSDQVMQDVPPSPAKVARFREDDDVSEPALKRSKTDAEGPSASEFKKPDLPDAPTNVNAAQFSHMRPDFANPPTANQYKLILRIIGNVKRTKDAVLFVAPVDPVALNIPTYPMIITNPMDLGTLEQKFKDHQYPTITAFLADFNLIVLNCEAFNGLSHAVTHSAHKMKASFDKQIERLPGPDVADSVSADKKKKPSVSSLDKPAAIRRESRSSLPGIARSPITPASPQTFALNPQGMPLIRRDSAADGRPKREIHPPAPKDLPYANQKPKKKKYLGELRFCEYVLGELKKPRYASTALYFLNPVDPVALNIPDYHKLIKRPMDLGTVGEKLRGGEYENAKEFEADVRLVFANCYKFNPPEHLVHQAGKSLESVFDSKMAEKQRWIENNVPLSGPTSPGSSPEASEDEDEEEEEDVEEQSAAEIRKLQEQIAAMSKQVELMNKNKKSPPAASKKSSKTAAKSDKKAKKAAPAPPHKAKPTPKPAAKKQTRYVTYEEKQEISNRINDLPEAKMATALQIIRNNMPSLKVRPEIYRKFSLRFKLRVILELQLTVSVGDCLSSSSASKDSQGDELELDIDELSNEVLVELQKFIKKSIKSSQDKAEKASPPAYAPAASSGTTRKKNKPMGKTEQESKIKQLESLQAKFTNPGSAERSIEYPAAPGMYPLSLMSGRETTYGSLDTYAVQENDTSGDDDDSEESEEE